VNLGTPKIPGIVAAFQSWISAITDRINSLMGSGSTANRPTKFLWVGRPYFNTDTGAEEWWDGASWVSGGGGGGGAPTTSQYVVMALDAALSAERKLAVSLPITLTDGGANNNATLDFDETVALGNNARVAVAKNSGATVGTRRRLNLIESAGISLTVADDAGSEEVDITIASTSTRSVGVTFDGGGSPIAALTKADIRIPYAGTITAVSMLADQVGSAVVDIWKDTYPAFPPTVADSITAAAKPTITADDQSFDSTLTGWTTGITANDCLRFNVDSCASITRLTLVLAVAA